MIAVVVVVNDDVVLPIDDRLQELKLLLGDADGLLDLALAHAVLAHLPLHHARLHHAPPDEGGRWGVLAHAVEAHALLKPIPELAFLAPPHLLVGHGAFRTAPECDVRVVAVPCWSVVESDAEPRREQKTEEQPVQ